MQMEFFSDFVWWGGGAVMCRWNVPPRNRRRKKMCFGVLGETGKEAGGRVGSVRAAAGGKRGESEEERGRP